MNVTAPKKGFQVAEDASPSHQSDTGGRRRCFHTKSNTPNSTTPIMFFFPVDASRRLCLACFPLQKLDWALTINETLLTRATLSAPAFASH